MMTRTRRLSACAVAACCAMVGCSSGGGGSGTPNGGAGGTGALGGAGGSGAASGSGGSGAVGGSGATGGSGGAAGTGGSGGGAPTMSSNTPGATFSQDAQGEAAGLVLISSKVTDKPSGGQYFQQWLALVENDGTSIVCFPQLEVSFKSAGAEVTSFYTFADAPPYDTGSSTLSTTCLAPGEIGGVYANGFANTPLPTSITQVDVVITGNIYPGTVPHPSAPTISNISLFEIYGAGAGYWAAHGTAIAAADIHNAGLDVYPVGADGLVPERLSDTHLDAFYQGSSWSFETSSYQGVAASGPIHAYVSFIDGAYMMLPPQAPEAYSSAALAAMGRAARTRQELREVQRLVRSGQRRLLSRQQSEP